MGARELSDHIYKTMYALMDRNAFVSRHGEKDLGSKALMSRDVA